MSAAPFTRTLPYVLREQLKGRELKLIVGTATAAPDTRHVTVQIETATFTIPRLKSYNPVTVGDPVFILAGPSLLLAIGSVR